MDFVIVDFVVAQSVLFVPEFVNYKTPDIEDLEAGVLLARC